MDPNAAMIVAAIEQATRNMLTSELKREAPPLNPKQPWSAHCSAMFRETMRQLRARGVPVSQDFVDENANANELASRIEESPEWEEVDADEAQSLANQGVLVVGTWINPDLSRMGHLAIVYPIDVKRTGTKGSEPLVRDGNIHRNTGALSSYGTAPASKAFPTIQPQPQWFEYRHTMRRS